MSYKYLLPLTVDDYKLVADRPEENLGLDDLEDCADTHWSVFKSPDGKNLTEGFSFTRTDEYVYFRTNTGAICKCRLANFVGLFMLVTVELFEWINADLMAHASTALEDVEPDEVPFRTYNPLYTAQDPRAKDTILEYWIPMDYALFNGAHMTVVSDTRSVYIRRFDGKTKKTSLLGWFKGRGTGKGFSLLQDAVVCFVWDTDTVHEAHQKAMARG